VEVTTRSGVYSYQQARRGSDVYAVSCKNCHTAEFHTAPGFVSKWDRRPLSDLYEYIRDLMPKNEPGSLSPEEYADVLAYILRLNHMPPGTRELAPDASSLKRIRIDITTIPVRKGP
jgi:mono/diheme cytochrome c family protein